MRKIFCFNALWAGDAVAGPSDQICVNAVCTDCFNALWAGDAVAGFVENAQNSLRCEPVSMPFERAMPLRDPPCAAGFQCFDPVSMPFERAMPLRAEGQGITFILSGQKVSMPFERAMPLRALIFKILDHKRPLFQCPLSGRCRCGSPFHQISAHQKKAVSMPFERAMPLRGLDWFETHTLSDYRFNALWAGDAVAGGTTTLIFVIFAICFNALWAGDAVAGAFKGSVYPQSASVSMPFERAMPLRGS